MSNADPPLMAAPDSGWAEFASFVYEGREPVYDQRPPGPGEFYNPILAGPYPNPSICRVGGDYYRVYAFAYRADGGAWVTLEENADGGMLDRGGSNFVGTYVGLYARTTPRFLE